MDDKFEEYTENDIENLAAAATSLTDDKLEDFCSSTEATMTFCTETDIISSRLGNIEESRSTGVSSFSRTGGPEAMDGLSPSEKLRVARTFDDKGFEEFIETADSRTIAEVRKDPFSKNRAEKLSNGNERMTNGNGRMTNGRSSFNDRLTDLEIDELTDSEINNITLTGVFSEDAKKLAKLPRSKVAELNRDDKYVSDILQSRTYQELRSARSPFRTQYRESVPETVRTRIRSPARTLTFEEEVEVIEPETRFPETRFPETRTVRRSLTGRSAVSPVRSRSPSPVISRIPSAVRSRSPSPVRSPERDRYETVSCTWRVNGERATSAPKSPRSPRSPQSWRDRIIANATA